MHALRPYSQIANDCNPLGVFLVKSSSTGNHLLFRYPFPVGSHQRRPSGSDKGVESIPEPAQRVVAPAAAQRALPPTKDHQISNAIHEFSDQVLTDLFAVKPVLCQQKFEVKINNIRFVGHPINLSDLGSNLSSRLQERVPTDLVTVNIVFALRANATHDIVNSYHECSQRISVALKFEEGRKGYLTSEAKSMLAFLDEETGSTDFDQILQKSLLAATLKKIYDDLIAFGSTHFTINHWMSISFCLPQKVHLMSLQNSHCHCPPIGPDRIRRCLEHLRPYHALLLLVDHENLLESLPLDASAAFLRVIRWISPLKNLIELSFDCDITLSQIFHVAAQLIYWGKVTVIFPLCKNNKYTVHPSTVTFAGSPMVQEFSKRFPKEDLLKLLSQFSSGITFKQAIAMSGDSEKMIQQVTWLLRHRLLLQMHTYVFLLPPDSNKLNECTLSEDQHWSKATVDSKVVDFVAKKKRSADRKDVSQAELFMKLYQYFDGTRHLEDIMFYENVQRSDMMDILNTFADFLRTTEYEDRAVAQLSPYSPLF